MLQSAPAFGHELACHFIELFVNQRYFSDL